MPRSSFPGFLTAYPVDADVLEYYSQAAQAKAMSGLTLDRVFLC